MHFEWDPPKDVENQRKHGVAFELAQRAFFDPNRVILKDVRHSTPTEERFFCLGKVDECIMTVRFVVRNRRIRIFGAGVWREGKKRYAKTNSVPKSTT